MANLTEVIGRALAEVNVCSESASLPVGLDVDALDATLADLREHLSLVTLGLARLPVKGSRGIRASHVLSVAGLITVYEKYVPRGRHPKSPVFAGCMHRVTRGACKVVSKCGATLGSMQEASQTITELLHFKLSASKVRAITLREGKRIAEQGPLRSAAFDKKTVIPGKCNPVEETMLLSVDGTCAPCSKIDTDKSVGRDGRPAKGRELKVGMAGVYKWLNKDKVPVIPANMRQYVVTHLDCNVIGTQLLELARLLGYATIKRVQFIGDGAAWIAKMAGDSFKGAEFTVDFYHACEYLCTLCKELGLENHMAIFKKVRCIMKTHSVDAALRHLQKRYPHEMKNANPAAGKAYAYLDERRKNMEYGRLRKQGYFIGSGHIESACKLIVGTRCKQAGMRWRHHNAAYVSSVRAAIRSNTFWAI